MSEGEIAYEDTDAKINRLENELLRCKEEVNFYNKDLNKLEDVLISYKNQKENKRRIIELNNDDENEDDKKNYENKVNLLINQSLKDLLDKYSKNQMRIQVFSKDEYENNVSPIKYQAIRIRYYYSPDDRPLEQIFRIHYTTRIGDLKRKSLELWNVSDPENMVFFLEGEKMDSPPADSDLLVSLFVKIPSNAKFITFILCNKNYTNLGKIHEEDTNAKRKKKATNSQSKSLSFLNEFSGCKKFILEKNLDSI